VLSSGIVGGASRRGLGTVRRALDWAHTLGADVVVAIAGATRGPLLGRRRPPIVPATSRRCCPTRGRPGVKLAIEVIHPLRQDLSFVNTVADASRLVRQAGSTAGYVLDTWHSGWEPRLLDVIARDGAGGSTRCSSRTTSA
jgi:sugar phosphate isomerase/epimerase